jgi:hypothetical protein
MFDFTRQNPRDDFHIAMAMRAEPSSGRDPIIVADKK